MITTINEFRQNKLNENAGNMIADKDWARMVDLVLAGDTDGSKVANSIKEKKKAIARFVCGLKLTNSPLRMTTYGSYSGSFRDLGDKAIKLGATKEEIQAVYDVTEVPAQYTEKMARLSGKKLNNRFVGALSKAVIDAGFDITYLPYGGNALTNAGRDAMARNGRKWTIGYKTEINLGDRTVKLAFDAITDEGDGPTSYVIHTNSNDTDSIFRNYNVLGKNAFVIVIVETIKATRPQ